jgi:hypothetical protein
MSPPRNVSPTRLLHTALDERLLAKVDLVLFSKAENRVPKGAYQRFFSRLLSWFFETKEVDLAPYVGSLPGECVVRANEATVLRLVAAFERRV